MESKSKRKKSGPRTVRSSATHKVDWLLHLYIAGQNLKAVTALNNLKLICEERLVGRYRLEVIDLLKQPLRARENQIIAVPTLVRKLPRPLKKVIGDLSNTESVLAGLDIAVSGAR